ncbi:MAG: metalloprotease TldD [Pseudomonadota bacterium]
MTLIETAQRQLLDTAELKASHLESVLGQLAQRRLDYADLYFQHCAAEGWSLEDGVVKEGSLRIEQGVGVRAIAGEQTGFAYSDDLRLPALESAARSARAIAASGRTAVQPLMGGHQPSPLYRGDNPLQSLGDADKVDLLQRADAAARAVDPRVSQVFVSLAGKHETVMVAATDGTWGADVRPLVRFNVTVIVEQKGRREQGTMGGGGRQGYALFGEDTIEAYAREAVRQALVNLEAVDAPAGAMPVVLGAGWPGILLHEAVGHGLEGDFNRKGTSNYAGKIGEKVASPACTIVDDGTLQDRRGSLTMDDEGTATERTVLIENGILKGYMQDKHNARLMGVAPTGNGRRESYAHLPMPRMTNTYMLPGQHQREEIIASVDKGLYAANFGGGQVDITSGQFVFSASEAYLIENGKITRPVKGATLIGNGFDTMNQVSMVGDDFALDSGVGTCGKDGQSVPVGVGQPTLKIDSITVGGTAT